MVHALKSTEVLYEVKERKSSTFVHSMLLVHDYHKLFCLSLTMRGGRGRGGRGGRSATQDLMRDNMDELDLQQTSADGEG